LNNRVPNSNLTGGKFNNVASKPVAIPYKKPGPSTSPYSRLYGGA